MAGRMELRDLLRYSAAGIEFVAAFGIGAGVGMYADSRSGGMLWTPIGAAVGFAAGLYRLIKLAGEYRRRSEGKDRP